MKRRPMIGRFSRAMGLGSDTVPGPESSLAHFTPIASLFANSSLPDYDESAAVLLTERVLAFLKRAE